MRTPHKNEGISGGTRNREVQGEGQEKRRVPSQSPIQVQPYVLSSSDRYPNTLHRYRGRVNRLGWARILKNDD